MDFVLVFPLILAFLSPGQCDTRRTNSSCYTMCPPGYYKVGDCDGQAAKYRCEKCDKNTFTEIENLSPKCMRCDSCGHHQTEIKPCSFTGDVVCGCQEGFFSPDSSGRHCQPCSCKDCKGSNNPDNTKSLRCLNDPKCMRKCNYTETTIPPSTNPPTTTSTSATPSTTISVTETAARPTTSHTSGHTVERVLPRSNQMTWLFPVAFLVAFLVLFWIMLLFTRNSCPCWWGNKELQPPEEDPKFYGKHSHQSNSPTTLTLNIPEETPMMLVSQDPATREHPAHIGPVLPDTEHKAARQDVQSEHWPAIVLYAIIKEVPLRRWKEFLRLLSVADRQLERVELEAGLGLGSIERQYQMLRLWSHGSSASLDDVFSALHYMDLSGCAQLLQESLEKLQWRPEQKQSLTDRGFNAAMQDT